MVDCSICFCPINKGENIQCSKWGCSCQVCDECFDQLLNFSYEGSLLPCCPSPDCKSMYLYKDIHDHCSSENRDKYHKTIFHFLIKNKGDEADKNMAYESMIKKLREKRQVYLETNFPPAILKVATIVFPHRLKKIERQHKERITKQITFSKPCFNLSCNGCLNKDFTCTICDTHFCTRCEKPIHGKFHHCNKEDVDTVNYIKTLVKCPNCAFTIIRSEGCPNMTCSHCGTNFNYLTGQEGGGGNHGQHQQIKLRGTYTLSSEFGEKMLAKHLELLLLFESYKPSEVHKESFMSTIQAYKQKKIKKSMAIIKLSKQYNTHIQRKYAMQKYMRISSILEDKIRKGNVDISDFNEALVMIET